MIRNQTGELLSPPIWVDFMARDDRSRVPLDFPGTLDDLAHRSVDLHDGMKLVLYSHDATEEREDDDLIGVGTAEFDPGNNRWFATFEWTQLRHLSDLDQEERALYQRARA